MRQLFGVAKGARALQAPKLLLLVLTALGDGRDDSAASPRRRISDLKAAAYSHSRVASPEADALQRVHLAGAKQRFHGSGAGDGLDVPSPDWLAAG